MMTTGFLDPYEESFLFAAASACSSHAMFRPRVRIVATPLPDLRRFSGPDRHRA